MYIPSTREEREKILREIGIGSVDELFEVVPPPARINGIAGLESALTEPELERLFAKMSSKNNTYPLFMGAGLYDHIIPAAVGAIVSLPQFVTAYTPYQPEISQGTLGAIFEFQTAICRLTGLDVSNASLYDAATAAAEAALMCAVQTKRTKICVTAATHPHIIEVLRTYARFQGLELTFAQFDEAGQAVLPCFDGFAAVIAQSPNFFGVIEPMADIASAGKNAGAVPVAVCDPLSLGLLTPPGEMGFDIAVGDCQPLGMPVSFGGPHAGYMAVREGFMRRMPGRIAGETTDNRGNRAFVLTLQAREQHIRREKATSNICSNQALMALCATVYLTLMGPDGLREAAEQSAQKAFFTREKLIERGFEPMFDAPFFREFAMRGEIKGAYRLDNPKGSLIAVTEKRTRDEIDEFTANA